MTTTAITNLKSVREALPHNYTSFQLLHTLDTLLLAGMSPIIKHSKVFDRLLASVVAWNVQNPRRKVCSIDKDTFITLAFRFLNSESHKERQELLALMCIERSVLFFAHGLFLRFTEESPDYSSVNAIGLKTTNTFLHHREVKFWNTEALAFQEMILQKYMRLVTVESSKFLQMQDAVTLDPEETAQTFMLGVTKAIHKCNAAKGTLTTYVLSWLRDARSNSGGRGEYGIAFSIPATERTRLFNEDNPVGINFAQPLDDAKGVIDEERIEDSVDSRNLVQQIQKIAKVLDPTGLGRIKLGIEEILS